MTEETQDSMLHLTKVGDFTVKKLSFGEFTLLIPKLVRIKNLIANSVTKDVTELTMQDIVMVIAINFQHLIPVIADCVKVVPEEIENLDSDVGLNLAFAIWEANGGTFLNFFGKGSQMMLRNLQ